jgi:group I intron endonuclease
MKDYCVYKHTFPNGKVYIGITCMKPEERWHSGWGYKAQPYVFHAIRKYGWKNVQHEIIKYNLTKEEAENLEIEMIAKFKSNQKDFGYNVANGGNSTGTMSEETKMKISNTLKGVPKASPPFKGKRHTDESKKKLSKKRLGKLNPMYGKHLSEETKRKMSEAHMNGALCKPILCIETGEIFVSSAEVAREMNLSQGNVASVARGARKHTKGFHFKYLEKGETDGTVRPGTT